MTDDASQIDDVGAQLAAVDAEAFRQEGPRADNRVGILATLLLGLLAAAGGIGALNVLTNRAHHAPVATVLLCAGATVFVVGLIAIVRLILPRLSRKVSREGVLGVVASLPDVEAACEHYRQAAQDRLAYQAACAWAHARLITRRNRRLRRGGWLLVLGVVLAAAGLVALGLG